MGYMIKIVMIGDEAVGKTSLRRCFMGQHFDSNYIQTIGADLSVKNLTLTINSVSTAIQYQIWDVAGQGSFSDIRSIYYKGVLGVIIAYDVTSRRSFDNVTMWIKEIKENIEKGSIPVVLLANKIDLRKSDDNSVSTSEGLQLAEKITEFYMGTPNSTLIPYFETSAKTGANVEMVFLKLLDMIIKHLN